jgi:hypothetical protein
MRKPNSIEHELNAVRIDLYEQTKGMTPSERVTYYRKLTSSVCMEFGIRTLNEIDNNSQKRAVL